MKPGYLTTEFWLTVLVGVLTNLGTIEVPDKYKWVVSLLLVVGYAISRGLAKFGPNTAPVVGTELPPEYVDPVLAEEADQAAVTAAAKPKAARAKRGRKGSW